MCKKIAVVLNDSGQTETIHESSVINVYSKEKDQWKAINQFPFTLKGLMVVKAIRENMLYLVETLGECKIIVAKELSGVPNSMLDMSGFTIVEVEGEPEEFLDDVLERIEEYEISLVEAAKEKEINTRPVSPKDDGHYYINLKELQNKNSGVTSKQALLPFLNNTIFHQLEIVCSHAPKWLEEELKRTNMKSTIEMVNPNEYKIVVCKKTCDEV